MKVIGLTQGRWALIDDADFPLVRNFTWMASYNQKSGKWYAMNSQGQGMHRLILGLASGDKRYVDHVEPESTLDNRRHNIRIASASNNQWNKRKNRNNTSGYKGVSWNRAKGKWQAQITVHNKNRFLGFRRTPEAAFYDLYVPAALTLHGDFARVI